YRYAYSRATKVARATSSRSSPPGDSYTGTRRGPIRHVSKPRTSRASRRLEARLQHFFGRGETEFQTILQRREQTARFLPFRSVFLFSELWLRTRWDERILCSRASGEIHQQELRQAGPGGYRRVRLERPAHPRCGMRPWRHGTDHKAIL